MFELHTVKVSMEFNCRLTISAQISIIARFLGYQISATNKLISVEQRHEGGKLNHGRDTKFKTSPFYSFQSHAPKPGHAGNTGGTGR